MAHLVRNGGLDALRSDPFTDFTVKCAEREWKVHRTTLCGDSPVLVLHCTQMMEAEKRELDLHEADPEAVERMLTYQYLGSYEDVDEQSSKQPSVSDPEVEGLDSPLYQSPEGFYAIPTRPSAAVSSKSIPSWKCDEVHPTITAMEAMTKDAITSILLLNINVFELAQRFALPDLEEYALQKLMSKERYFCNCHLDKLLSLVFDVTAHDDTKLRFPIFLRCVENHAIVQSLPKPVEQLDSQASLAWRYAIKVQQDLTDKDKDMQMQKSAQKAELRMQEKTSRREARELRSTIRQKDSSIEYLEDDVRNLERKLERARKETKRLRQRFNYWGHA